MGPSVADRWLYGEGYCRRVDRPSGKSVLPARATGGAGGLCRAGADMRWVSLQSLFWRIDDDPMSSLK